MPNPGPNLGKHEGDWEHIAIMLDKDNNTPVKVKYFYHHNSCQLPWPQVPKYTTHPKTLVALNSHGNYPPGFGQDSWFGYKDKLSTTGERWYATRNLQNAKTQAWYGYAGAWGEMGKSSDNTGPWGPNDYRGGVGFGVKKCGS